MSRWTSILQRFQISSSGGTRITDLSLVSLNSFQVKSCSSLPNEKKWYYPNRLEIALGSSWPQTSLCKKFATVLQGVSSIEWINRTRWTSGEQWCNGFFSCSQVDTIRTIFQLVGWWRIKAKCKDSLNILGLHGDLSCWHVLLHNFIFQIAAGMSEKYIGRG